MGRKAFEPTVIFMNHPDPGSVWEVLCELLNRQDPEYEYRLISKKEEKKEKNEYA